MSRIDAGGNTPTSLSDGELLTGRVVGGTASARVSIDGRDYINFSGCGYLALGRLPELRNAALVALEQGAPFARQISAAYGAVDPAIRDLESTAAVYCGTGAAVYFASGYLIGAIALQCVDTAHSMLFIDRSAHFSLFDGARLTGLPLTTFAHCDAEALATSIEKNLPPRSRPIVITDGVFATTGRLAPLDQYATVIAGYGGTLVVDEAHSFGVIGPRGRGAAELLGVEAVARTAATLSKAFCAQGALIGCDHEQAARLRHSPPLRGANSGSPISAAVSAAALNYTMAHPERRSRLATLTTYLRRGLRGIGIDVDDSPAPIVGFSVGDRVCMKSLQRRLFDRGIHVTLSNYIGAGPQGMIRCAVFADHSEADLDALVDGLR
jgi:7-keto-8-aminopelargonate synthetase-like enzyme